MAKSNQNVLNPLPPETLVAVTPEVATTTPKPKKSRKPGIKYKLQIASTPPQNNGNPLDQLAIPHRGGFKFPGLVFETTLAGCIVKFPATGNYAVRPTIRDVFTMLVTQFDKPTG